jgi:hypothetical protein
MIRVPDRNCEFWLSAQGGAGGKKVLQETCCGLPASFYHPEMLVLLLAPLLDL